MHFTSKFVILVRHIRCRPGDNARAESDSLSVSSGRDIIVDHCSASWSVDETLSASSRGRLGNVTVQWCIISESLHNSIHHKGPHGYGSLIRGSSGNGYTYHHNLYAHHQARLPRPGNYIDRSRDPDGFFLDFRNNVIYNWAGRTAGYNADGSNGTNSITKMNFAGNYYKTGINSKGNLAFSESTTSARAWFGGWPELKSAEPPDDSDKDGMPDDWEKQHGFDPDDPTDGNGDSDADGYTNLEEYLNNTKP